MIFLGLKFVIIVLYFSFASSQHCEEWNTLPSECGNYGMMKPGVMIFIPQNETQQLLSNQANFWIQNTRTLFSVHAFTIPCILPSFEILCATWLRPCAVIDGEVFPIPVDPCMDIYNWANESCFPLVAAAHDEADFGSGNYIPKGDSLPMSLNWTDPDAGGVPFFQFEGYNYTLANGSQIFIQCNNGGGLITNVTAGQCSPPLITGSIGNQQICLYECNIPGLTQNDANTQQIIYAVLGSIGLIICGCLLIIYIINPRLRTMPFGINTFTIMWGLVVAIALTYPAITGWRYKQIWCEGNEFIPTATEVIFETPSGVLQASFLQLNDFTAGRTECSMEGFMLYIGLLGMLSATLHENLYQCVIILKSMFPNRLAFIKMPEGPTWVSPFIWNNGVINILIQSIVAIIIASSGAGLWGGDLFVMSTGSPYCFLNPNNVATTVILWIVPILFMLVVLVICTIFMSIFLIIKAINLGLRNIYGDSFLIASIIVFINGVMVVIVYIGIIFSALYLEQNYGSISNTLTNYYQCVINPYSEVCLTDPNQGSYSIPIKFSGIITVLAPILITGIYFIRFKFWKDNYRFIISILKISLHFEDGPYKFLRACCCTFISSNSTRTTSSSGKSLSMTDWVEPEEDELESESDSDSNSRTSDVNDKRHEIHDTPDTSDEDINMKLSQNINLNNNNNIDNII